jgi:DNA-binding beta-propeller fold protein YncE
MPWRSPIDAAYSPCGRWLAISDASADELVIAPAAGGQLRRVPVRGSPAGLQWSADGSLIWVAEPNQGAIAEVDALAGRINRRVSVARRPVALAAVAQRNVLLVADEATDEVVAIDLATGRAVGRIAVLRSPSSIAVSPDGRLAVVANRLPAGDASAPGMTSGVTLIDLATSRRAADVMLPANSTNLRGVAVSPDGRWAYVAHALGRSALATTQIEYGWINANALSIIDLAGRKRHATILLDQAQRGCADPWGVALAMDGKSLWVALSGVHQMARLDLPRLHSELDKRKDLLTATRPARSDGPISDYVTPERSPLVDEPSSVELVVTDKPSAYGMGVYLPGIIQRLDLPGLGPRGLAMSGDGRTLAVAMYYSGQVALLDTASAKVTGMIDLGPQPPADAIRRGEIAFHDARLCYQQWLSCATCHPDGRADGLNWDLMNDGVGNPKNTRSLVLSHRTAPMMSRGARDSFQAAVAAGFKHILFKEGTPEVRADVEAYLGSLKPQPSPFLVAGKLSEKAGRGKALFEDGRTGCASCHSGELLTDLKLHGVGTRVETDWEDETAFVTPKLVELWRTAPYLHHGKAATLRDVLTTHNRGDRHGRTSQLNEEELEALVEYMKAL